MLCDKNEKLPLKFTLFSLVDIEENKSLPYGSMQTTLAEIKNFKSDKEIELINEKGKGKLGATLKFLEFKIEEKLSFVEYLKKGWFINLSVAIDFTASNGELHNINENPDVLNDY